MDFLSFKTCALMLPNDISIILRGRHGIGKSQLIRDLSKELNMPLIDRRLSQLSEGDLIGLPKLDDRSTRFMPPKWLVRASESPHILFLDEFDRSTLEVQQAAMELILERSIQSNKIHPQCRIFAAINGGKYGSMYSVNKIDPALNDRFWIADVEPTIDEWIQWGKKDNNVIPEITDFIHTHRECLETKELPKNDFEITPSRRSWKRLSDTLSAHPNIFSHSKKNKKVFINLCSGFVGLHISSKFRNFIEERNKHINIDEILNNFDKNEDKIKNLGIEQLNLGIDKISDHSKNDKAPEWTKEQAFNISKFFVLLPDELKVSMWKKLSQPGCKLSNSRLLGVHINDIIMDLMEAL